MKEHISKKEAAALFGRSVSTLDRWAALGYGPKRCFLGGSVVYLRREVEDFLASLPVGRPPWNSSRAA